ncbi:tyrosine-type recombinase/integrase [Candidatus Galacturonibacter soehngenii]|uniref:Tyrosine-type recombinase/integrase n=1 Tax=Candidatus Galacturonatibacter soehngenii TaxID=2307010 RepID=A0A7V7QKA2_9FIRM|nr:tyrosine-type recombinase/integrase [Candidatus Galacturonibacter soehngenii]KAB1438066.1 tyrosine-type recombinase/integrase [Candidatus Galacturonibacter soehngenii]
MELYGDEFRNFAGFKGFASLPVWTDSKELKDRKLVFDLNKRTKAVDEETYKRIVSVMKEGFCYQGVDYKPNERIATVLILEYNLGLRVGDILNLTVDSFVKDGNRYRLDIYEQKTGKYRNFTVPDEVYQFIRDYAYEHNISPKSRLFPITERAVLKHLKVVCEYLGLIGIGSHSFRKAFATNVYVNNHYNIELVRTLLQHSSVIVTQRYIGIGSKELEDAIQKNICLG